MHVQISLCFGHAGAQQDELYVQGKCVVMISSMTQLQASLSLHVWTAPRTKTYETGCLKRIGDALSTRDLLGIECSVSQSCIHAQAGGGLSRMLSLSSTKPYMYKHGRSCKQESLLFSPCNGTDV